MSKLLLMGSAGAGKTSMQRVLFANMLPKETSNIGYTVAREEHKIYLLGGLTFSLWDCGFQDQFVQEYFDSQKETIFSQVHLLLYVFDVTQSKCDQAKSLATFGKTLKSLELYSPKAEVFVLVHKMDQVSLPSRAAALNARKESISTAVQGHPSTILGYLGTSIWDKSLYEAWSTIFRTILPHKQTIHKQLQRVREACNCDEVVLLEKSTLLVLGQTRREKDEDMLSCQRLANLLKFFKITLKKAGARLKELEFKAEGWKALLIEGKSEYIVLVGQGEPAGCEAWRFNAKRLGIKND